jgi:hypothetical protein
MMRDTPWVRLLPNSVKTLQRRRPINNWGEGVVDKERRERIIAGTVAMVSAELSSLPQGSLREVVRQAGRTRCIETALLVIAAAAVRDKCS